MRPDINLAKPRSINWDRSVIAWTAIQLGNCRPSLKHGLIKHNVGQHLGWALTLMSLRSIQQCIYHIWQKWYECACGQGRGRTFSGPLAHSSGKKATTDWPANFFTNKKITKKSNHSNLSLVYAYHLCCSPNVAVGEQHFSANLNILTCMLKVFLKSYEIQFM